MSFKDTYAKLVELGETPSTNDKKELLAEYLKDDFFTRVVQMTLDTRLTYNVKRFPAFAKLNESDAAKNVPADEAIFDYLNELASLPGASNDKKQKLFDLISSSNETYEVVKRICNGNLKCGCSVKLVNTAQPDTVFNIFYCRCSTESKIDKVFYPAIAQEKADGMFCNMFVSKKGKVKFLTRDGKKVQQLKKLKKLIQTILPKYAYGKVFHGELLIMGDNGTPLDRTTGNGIFNSCIYGSADQAKADKAIIKLWDVVPINAFWQGHHPSVPYTDRWELLLNIVNGINNTYVNTIHTKIVNSYEEAKGVYAELRKLGCEGAILKDFNQVWKDHTSPLQIKMKNVMDVELEIVAWYYGDSEKKYGKCLGGITCRSSCGNIVVNVGTGFPDKLRGFKPVKKKHKNAVLTGDELEGTIYIDGKFAKKVLKDWDMKVGKIAQLECESIIKSKTKDTYSLFLPRFIEIREDKDTADTLKGLQSR